MAQLVFQDWSNDLYYLLILIYNDHDLKRFKKTILKEVEKISHFFLIEEIAVIFNLLNKS